MRHWWPRARSKLFEEPKKLAAMGLARAKKERIGKRPQTVYSITPAGQRALAAWLKSPGGGPSLESEQLTKLFFVDHGTAADAISGRRSARVDACRPYLVSEGPFPERVATNMIIGRFMLDYFHLINRWARWAEAMIDGWPDDPSRADPDWSVMEDIVRTGDEVLRAERRRRKRRSAIGR